MANYSHNKCYANKTNNCSKKISSEHILSNNILKLFEHNKTVKLAGLPWIEHETFNLLSRNSLVANILCTGHNASLSPYDTEAGKLFRLIKGFDQDFDNPSPKTEHESLNGQYIEKWMLKIVCGLIASRQISSQGSRISSVIKDEYIDILFNNSEWPKHWGLYFKIPDTNQVHKYDCLSFVPMTGNNEVKAAEFLVNNFKFYLVLGNPDNLDAWGIHRINKFHFTNGKVAKTLELKWNDPSFDKWISFTRGSTTKEPPADWHDWMKK
jgi:hypothetical protein